MTKKRSRKAQGSMGATLLVVVVGIFLYLISAKLIVLPPAIATAVAGIFPATTPAAVAPLRSNATAAPRDPSNAAHLPDSQMTPGDTLPVTNKDICVSGYSSKVRNVPQSVKDQAYAEYGIASHVPGAYEVDHLISLELGGSNSIKNLWPEPYTGNWNAHVKDKLENKLHELVCAGTLNLKQAQQEESSDWVSAYVKYIGQP